ncbi:LysR family transcriptional regulator [Cumulibacter manganitolerans]|uniref:LysR family transcriptional regulator n=1 Tax=Cumulibacter manganitolerans TaxID=1884992 RepID=UPI001298139A|nr:LysR substrate-binding domain-containing protein [Cumulibacter manganitolerans]
MELRHIRALVAVAEHQHFSRAAASLHMSQPPLSAAIRELERELGVTLFERTTRSVQLTADGRAMLEPARRVLRGLEELRMLAAARLSGAVGTVRAGFGGTSGYSILADLVRAAREQAPGLQIELAPQTYSGDALQRVLEGELDLAISGSRPPRDLDSLVLRDERLVLAVPTGHPLSGRHRVEADDLAGVPMVMYPGEHGSWVRRAAFAMLERAGLAPEVAAEAPDPFSLLALVAAGIGAAVVVDTRGRIHVEGVRYLPFGPSVSATFPLRMVWHGSRASPATLSAVAISRGLVERSAVGAVQQQR